MELQPWVAPCNVKEVANLMWDLKSRGMDLAAFEAKELFDFIKGRTLWYAPANPRILSQKSARSCQFLDTLHLLEVVHIVVRQLESGRKLSS